MTELLAGCEPLISERACLIPLALLLNRIQSQSALDKAFARAQERAARHDEFDVRASRPRAPFVRDYLGCWKALGPHRQLDVDCIR